MYTITEFELLGPDRVRLHAQGEEKIFLDMKPGGWPVRVGTRFHLFSGACRTRLADCSIQVEHVRRGLCRSGSLWFSLPEVIPAVWHPGPFWVGLRFERGG